MFKQLTRRALSLVLTLAVVLSFAAVAPLTAEAVADRTITAIVIGEDGENTAGIIDQFKRVGITIKIIDTIEVSDGYFDGKLGTIQMEALIVFVTFLREQGLMPKDYPDIFLIGKAVSAGIEGWVIDADEWQQQWDYVLSCGWPEDLAPVRNSKVIGFYAPSWPDVGAGFHGFGHSIESHLNLAYGRPEYGSKITDWYLEYGSCHVISPKQMAFLLGEESVTLDDPRFLDLRLDEGYSVGWAYGYAEYLGDSAHLYWWIEQAQEQLGAIDLFMAWLHKGLAPLPAPSYWAIESINTADSLGLSTSELSANYQATTTRAEFCRAAVNFLRKFGFDVDGVTPKLFADTTDRDIGIAAAIGITSGTDAAKNLFSPDNTLTREQAAGMLRNVLNVIGADTKTSGVKWTDADSISSYTKDAADVMYTAKIMGGTSTTALVFSPKTPYTHEQSIGTLVNLWEYLK
jgi:hypothetical protein